MATPGNLGSSVLASKTKTKKKHFVAQKVKLFRASDPLLSVLMWGVNHSVRARLRRAVPFLLLLLFLLVPLLLRLQLLRGGEPEPAPALRLFACLGAPSPAASAPSPPGRPGTTCVPFRSRARCGTGVLCACGSHGGCQCRPQSARLRVGPRCLGGGKFVRGMAPPRLSARAGAAGGRVPATAARCGGGAAPASSAGGQVYLSRAGRVRTSHWDTGARIPEREQIWGSSFSA